MKFTQYIQSKLVKVFLLKVNLISAFDSSDWFVVFFFSSFNIILLYIFYKSCFKFTFGLKFFKLVLFLQLYFPFG